MPPESRVGLDSPEIAEKAVARFALRDAGLCAFRVLLVFWLGLGVWALWRVGSEVRTLSEVISLK